MTTRRADLCIVSASLDGGGAEKVAVNLANYFSSLGRAVDLVVLRRGEDAYRESIASSVNVVDLNAPRLRHSVAALRRYLKHHQPAKVLTAVRDVSVVTAIASTGLQSKPVMFFREANTYHDLKVLGPWKGPVLRLGMKWSYRRARLMIANSNDTRRDVLSLGVPGLRIEVIHNPVLQDNHRSDCGPLPAHPWCGDASLQVVLAVGRLEPQKDYPTLIRAFGLVYEQALAVRLIILGVGPEERNLRALVMSLGLYDVVDLAGFVLHPAPFYVGARVFVSASRWEGFGNVIVEALAAGTSVVVTDCPGGPREIVAGGQYGDVVPVGDHGAMAEAIVRNLKARRDPRVLQSRAEDFTIGRIGPQYARALGIH